MVILIRLCRFIYLSRTARRAGVPPPCSIYRKEKRGERGEREERADV